MKVNHADERATRWETVGTTFRVMFFSGDAPGYIVEAYDVLDADLLDVVEWAESTAGPSRIFSVALVDESSRVDEAGTGLIWLVGMDANDTPSSDLEYERLSAMMRNRLRRQGQ